MKGSTLLQYAGNPEKESLWPPPQPPPHLQSNGRGHASHICAAPKSIFLSKSYSLWQEALPTSKQTTLDAFFITVHALYSRS